jgi:flavin-dependent dehydrogenase
MLMALESGELAARTLAPHLKRLREGSSFDLLAREYGARYLDHFDSRLRVCSLLRRAAFMPRLAEAAVYLAGASAGLRRRLARATRSAAAPRF